MVFKCKSCDAVMVFDPELQELKCPFCDSVGTEEKVPGDSLTICRSCGGELTPGEYTSADKCPYCGNYLIYDERVENEYKPDRIIPFRLSKKMAAEAIDKELGGRKFTPSDFLSEKTLDSMVGYYAPFFMYDYNAEAEYEGEGTKVTKEWMEGSYKKTEISRYKIVRRMKASFDNIPASASDLLTDYSLGFIEPYDYRYLKDFDPKLMSGFLSEIYNKPADILEPTARGKAEGYIERFMADSMSGMSLSLPHVDSKTLNPGKPEYTLFPFWRYFYHHGSNTYVFDVNGQTGKVYGKAPVSKRKVFVYALASGGMWALILSCLAAILGF